jgi:hypothetical protein
MIIAKNMTIGRMVEMEDNPDIVRYSILFDESSNGCGVILLKRSDFVDTHTQNEFEQEMYDVKLHRKNYNIYSIVARDNGGFDLVTHTGYSAEFIAEQMERTRKRDLAYHDTKRRFDADMEYWKKHQRRFFGLGPKREMPDFDDYKANRNSVTYGF